MAAGVPGADTHAPVPPPRYLRVSAGGSAKRRRLWVRGVGAAGPRERGRAALTRRSRWPPGLGAAAAAAGSGPETRARARARARPSGAGAGSRRASGALPGPSAPARLCRSRHGGGGRRSPTPLAPLARPPRAPPPRRAAPAARPRWAASSWGWRPRARLPAGTPLTSPRRPLPKPARAGALSELRAGRSPSSPPPPGDPDGPVDEVPPLRAPEAPTAPSSSAVT